MSFTILSRRAEQTVFTTVEYTFDNQTVTVEIPHFMPASEEDIIKGIENREVTERAKLLTEPGEVS
jgi:hypothetical protein